MIESEKVSENIINYIVSNSYKHLYNIKKYKILDIYEKDVNNLKIGSPFKVYTFNEGEVPLYNNLIVEANWKVYYLSNSIELLKVEDFSPIKFILTQPESGEDNNRKVFASKIEDGTYHQLKIKYGNDY